MNEITILLIVIVIVLLLMIIIRFPRNKVKKTCSKDGENIRKSFRQTARWSNAALQDKAPMIALLHANYGAGYLWALKDLYTEEEIRIATGGITFAELEKKVLDVQNDATLKVYSVCPHFATNLNPQLTKWSLI